MPSQYLQEQVESVRFDPNSSPQHVAWAESWLINQENDAKRRVQEMERQRVAAIVEKADSALARTDSIETSATADRDAMRAGDMTAQEFMRKRRTYLSALDALERLAEGLESNALAVAYIGEDPAAYLYDEFFSKWFPQRRPLVGDYIDKKLSERLSR